MAVRALFYVHEKAETLSGINVKMRPVTKGNEEEKAFWKATPSGSLEMLTVNQAAADFFKVGGEYYLTFEEYQG